MPLGQAPAVAATEFDWNTKPNTWALSLKIWDFASVAVCLPDEKKHYNVLYQVSLLKVKVPLFALVTTCIRLDDEFCYSAERPLHHPSIALYMGIVQPEHDLSDMSNAVLYALYKWGFQRNDALITSQGRCFEHRCQF